MPTDVESWTSEPVESTQTEVRPEPDAHTETADVRQQMFALKRKLEDAAADVARVQNAVASVEKLEQLLKQRERELSDRLSGQKYLGRSRPAKASELAAGAAVNDKTGVVIARIDQIDTDGVVVSNATGKVKVPADAFGYNKAGVLLDMTKAQFEQIVKKANAGS